jgi:hypothetical protein
MKTNEQQFDLIERAIKGQADGYEALDALMDFKTKYLNLSNALIDFIGCKETSIDIGKLEEQRTEVAESLFEEAILPPIEDFNGSWEYNGKNTFVRTVFWTDPNGGPSVKGNYKVEFQNNTATVKGSWHS